MKANGNQIAKYYFRLPNYNLASCNILIPHFSSAADNFWDDSYRLEIEFKDITEIVGMLKTLDSFIRKIEEETGVQFRRELFEKE